VTGLTIEPASFLNHRISLCVTAGRSAAALLERPRTVLVRGAALVAGHGDRLLVRIRRPA